MPDTPDNLSSTVSLTAQPALDALGAQQARPQPLDADLQAQAEQEVALEFARAGKLAPSDGEFDDATQERLEQFREQARLRLSQQAQEAPSPSFRSAPIPLPGATLGATGTAYTSANSAVGFQYAVVPGQSLVTSQGLDARPNPAYDQSLQGRDRGRASSLAQIQDIAAHLNPERLGANPLVSEGAPIVGSDGQVESGNGRSLAILTAYDQGLPSAQAYQQHLTENAAQYGLTAGQVSAVENPVLVRVRQTEMDVEQRAQFAQAANISSVAQMSDVERAQRDAGNLLRSPALSQFVPSETGGIAPGPNREFLRSFAETLPPEELGGFVQGNGEVSQGGLRQAQNALLAAAYPGSQTLSRLVESPDDNTRNIGQAMLNASGRFAQTRQQMERGELHDLDISPHVAQAADILSGLREQNKPVSSYMAEIQQPDLFGGRAADELSPVVPDLLEMMDANKRSPRKLTKVLGAYTTAVEALGNPQQQSLMDAAPPTRQEVLASARGLVERGPTASQTPIEFTYDPDAPLPAVRQQAAGSQNQSAPISSFEGDAESSALGSTSDFSQTEPVAGPAVPRFQTKPAPPRARGFDAESANARAAARPFTTSPIAADYNSSSFSAPAGAGSAFTGLSFNSPEVEAEAVSRAWRGPRAGGKDNDGGGGNGGGLPPGIAGSSSGAAGGNSSAADDYDAIMQRRRDIETDQRNKYSVAGRFSEIDAEPARRERLEAYKSGSIATHQELASLAPEPVVSGYHERAARKQEIEASLRETYTQDGKFDKIGGREFNKERDAFYRDEHLIEPKRRGLSGAMENLREDKMGLAFGIGFSAISIGSGAAGLSELTNGQYVSPEALQRAQVNAVAPGAAGIAGTLIGTVLGGAPGGLAGQFIGGAVGQAGSAIFGAASEREETTRQTAETLASALGESASRVREFSEAISATGVPVKQMQAALASVGQSGTFGAGTVAGVGALTNAFGEHADADWQAISKYAANPMLHGIAGRFSGGQGGSADIDALAYDAAENGDFGTLKQLQQAAEDARVKDDPQFQAAAKHIDDVSNSKFGLGAAGVAMTRFAREHGIDIGHTDITDALDTEDKRRAKLGPDPHVAEENRIANEFADAKSRGLGADANISRVTAEGGSAADIASARDAARGVLAGNITRYQADKANPLNKGRKDELDAKINQAQAALATLSHSDFEDSLKERTAGFSLAQTRARLEGRSAADISREMNRQADYLQDVQGPIGPAERSGLQEQAAQLRYTAKTSVYDEDLSRIDLRSTQAQERVGKAQVTGGPEEVYQAQQGVLQTYTARIRELTQEISHGGLTVSDRIAKEKELSGARAASVQLSFQAQQEQFTARRGIAQDVLGADTDGLSRQIAIRGNAAVTPALLREAGSVVDIDAAQLAADEKRYPGNKALLARERRTLAGDTLTREDLTREAQTYTPDVENQIQDANLRGEQFRANRLGGQAAMEAARGSLQNDRQDLVTLEATDRTATDLIGRATNARNRQALENSIAEDTTRSQTLSLSPEQRMQDATIRQARELSLEAPYTEEGGNPYARNAAQIAQDKKRAAEFTEAAAAATDPLAKEDNQNKAFGYQREAAGLEKEQRNISAQLLPEMISGGGGGVGSAVVPFTALSAALGTNTPFTGSWGGRAAHPAMPNGEGAGSLANRFGIWTGSAADFAKAHPNAQAGHEAQSGPLHAPSSGGDSSAQMIALLSRIALALEKRVNPGSSLPQAHAGTLLGVLGNALNAHGIH